MRCDTKSVVERSPATDFTSTPPRTPRLAGVVDSLRHVSSATPAIESIIIGEKRIASRAWDSLRSSKGRPPVLVTDGLKSSAMKV
ncbi:hypothetical protein EVAR_49189_1 [Eumeta japonica]|uniref:Uncharacterized protein n=1 Tax=Eumeta variegata TaxID=151549 RepID=A0A4C1XLV4_EUMVA|nr:hypothetical protein EVAR_49189_1 [Eumeta japonica]